MVGRPYPVPGGEPGLDGCIGPAKFHDVFAQDLPRSQTRLMATAQRPGSVGVFGRSQWLTDVEGCAVQVGAGSRVVQAEGASHVVMMSRPDTVVRHIEAAYRATR
ncbi:hypothetical protein [Streptomyces sp. YS415]|uniref:hypothetical protein n=1 Tax=Streptomyces sp. YS415 TaxID=2944806 RepID=UPI002021BBA9|nr:hypothetical protein [Streptomyces sp. YS415]MCL7424914.1 hypothetical protein [Streptomyces sp. YS415]